MESIHRWQREIIAYSNLLFLLTVTSVLRILLVT